MALSLVSQPIWNRIKKTIQSFNQYEENYGTEQYENVTRLKSECAGLESRSKSSGGHSAAGGPSGICSRTEPDHIETYRQIQCAGAVDNCWSGSGKQRKQRNHATLQQETNALSLSLSLSLSRNNSTGGQHIQWSQWSQSVSTFILNTAVFSDNSYQIKIFIHRLVILWTSNHVE